MTLSHIKLVGLFYKYNAESVDDGGTTHLTEYQNDFVCTCKGDRLSFVMSPGNDSDGHDAAAAADTNNDDDDDVL